MPTAETLEAREVLSGLAVVDPAKLLAQTRLLEQARRVGGPQTTAVRFSLGITSEAADRSSIGNASGFAFVADRWVRVGTPATVELTARTARGRIGTSYSGTVVLASSDPNAVFASQTVTFAAGKATVEVTFAATGRQTITATDEATGKIRGRAAVRVVAPLQVARFAVVIGDGGGGGAGNTRTSAQGRSSAGELVRVGSPTTVRVVALDAQRRVVWNYDGEVAVTSTDAGAKLPGVVKLVRGRASFDVTFSAEGEQSLTAADSEDPNLSGTGKAVVAPAQKATHFAVTIGNDRVVALNRVAADGTARSMMMPPIFWDPTVRVGSPALVSIVALDERDAPVSDFSGTVTLGSSDPNAVFAVQKITFYSGYAFAEVTFSQTGRQTVDVVAADDATLVGSGSVDVQAAQTVTHFGVTIGSPFAYVMPLLGAAGGESNGATGAANLTIARPYFWDDAVRTGVPTGVRIVALDKDDRPVWNFAGRVTLECKTDAGAVFAADALSFSYGYAWTQVTFSQTGTQVVTVADANDANVAGTGKVVVEAPLKATHFGVYLGPEIWPLYAANASTGASNFAGGNVQNLAYWLPEVRVGAPATVRLVALDDQNRPVWNYAGSVTFSSSDPNAAFDPTSVTFAGGYASTRVTFAAAGKQTVTVVATDDASLSGTGSVDVQSSAANV